MVEFGLQVLAAMLGIFCIGVVAFFSALSFYYFTTRG